MSEHQVGDLRPECRHRHDDGPWPEHIRDRERLDVGDAETGRQHQHAAAGGEVRLHTGARQREDQPGAEKEKKLKDKLRRATNATTLPSEEAKIAAVKKSRMAFVQSTVVAGQPGIERTEKCPVALAQMRTIMLTS